MIMLSHWEEYVNKNILDGYVRISRREKSFGRVRIEGRKQHQKYDVKYNQDNMFKIINTMAHVLTHMMTSTLDKFVQMCNVEDDAPGTIFMKNEYLFERMLNTDSKKHYMATIRLQEGVYNAIPDKEIKGMEWNKPSYASDFARKFNSKLVFEDVLGDKDPDVSSILSKVAEFENSIYDNIMSGKFDFLKVNKVKSEDGYADAMSIGPYKATFVWNHLCPEEAVSEFPARVHILKVNLDKPKDFADLSVKNKEVFDRLMDLFENNDRIKKSGITSIAIPLDSKIPEWIKSYINIDDIIMNNIKLTFPILNALGLKTIHKSKSKAFFSNIIEV